MQVDPSTTGSRPLMLLDVDGVINALGVGTDEDYAYHYVDDYYIRVHRATPERLGRLANVSRLVWATAWEGSANALGPLLGLPPLPYIRFDDESAPDETWKLSAIKRFVGDRPLAWIDDDIGPDAELWAKKRGAPTLLRRARPDLGISDGDVETILEFVARAITDLHRSASRPIAKSCHATRRPRSRLVRAGGRADEARAHPERVG